MFVNFQIEPTGAEDFFNVCISQTQIFSVSKLDSMCQQQEEIGKELL